MIKLFEGAGAHEAALAAASLFGPLFYPEITGLKKDEAREIVERMNSPIGMDVVIVVGPMDNVRQASSDALLKVIEEPPCSTVHLYMWCEDAAQVSPTIVSRVVPEFVGGTTLDEGFDVDIFVNQDPSLFSVLQEWKGRESEFLRAIASNLDYEREDHLRLWERLRPLASSAILTPSMILAAWFD